MGTRVRDGGGCRGGLRAVLGATGDTVTVTGDRRFGAAKVHTWQRGCSRKHSEGTG